MSDHCPQDGGTHRDHFYPLETDERNIPLTVEDLEIIPSIWREPDNVTTKTSKSTRIMIERKSLDGGTYKMVVDVEDQPYLVTFYKNVPGGIPDAGTEKPRDRRGTAGTP